METLAKLREIAKNDPTKRSVLLMLPNRRMLNGRFIDPWLGAMEMVDLPGKAVYTRDLDEHNTTGIFTDPEHECKPDPNRTEVHNPG